MQKRIITGLLSMLAVVSTIGLAQAGQAQSSWKTAVKITCDRTVPQGDAVNVFVCTDSTCNTYAHAGALQCGTNLGMRTTGHRVETNFKPTVFKYSLEVRNQFNDVICSNQGEGMPVGNTVTCNGAKSPKLSVGRPH